MLRRIVCIVLSLIITAVPITVMAETTGTEVSAIAGEENTNGSQYAGSAGEDYENTDIYFDFGYKNKSVCVSYVVGQAFGSFPSPERKGYVLKGWYTKKSGGKRIKESTLNTFKDGTRIYARWQRVADMKTSFKSASCSKHVMRLEWGAVKGAKKYQLCFSLSNNFKVKRTENLKKNSVKIRGGAAGTRYYFKVRAQVKDSAGKLQYTKWSSIKSVIVK